MKCRICGNVGMLLQEVTGVELDVNRVYTKPVNSKRSETTIFGFCERCKHGQLDNVFNANHYDEYNLLFIDKNAGGVEMHPFESRIIGKYLNI